MTEVTLTKVRLIEGTWEGLLQYSGDDIAKEPDIEVIHHQEVLKNLDIKKVIDREGAWSIRVPVPVECLSDGVQTFLIRDKQSSETLNKFAIVAGEPLEDDIRAEVTLLREELDMLKRAFRRHCLETLG